ncbi:MAG: FAD-dependent oxidoreductase [Planctomycetota bacterium]|jgi:phytoene dehydrogenase-like protein|nr:FAD-dependent oxidoreductase [Planctomycetota bacterium]
MLLASMAGAGQEYDVAVIGGGLGGMTAAKRLADAGRSVLLVEGYSRLGGYATWFKRRGHIFDVALHAFPYGMAKTLRKYWSKELAARVVPLRRIRFDNPEFSFTTTFETADFQRILREEFGVPDARTEAFFAACRNMDFYGGSGETTREFLERLFPGRLDVMRVLLETVTYATGTNLDDPAMVYAIVFSNFAQKGTCTFSGGTDYLLAEMQRLLLESGVDILLRTKVDGIEVANGRAAGISAAGRSVSARAVVSNANLKETCLGLMDMESACPPFAGEVQAVPLSVSVAQVYMGVRPGEAIPEIADILFSSREPRYDAAALTIFPPRSISYSFYYPHHVRPDYGGTEIVASMCADYADWEGLPEEEYEKKKETLTRTVLDDLSRYIPAIRTKLDHVEAATPRTLERFTGHWRGASFGTKFPGFVAAEKLPGIVKGLYHCGSQGILMSGWLGSANSGALTAGKVDAFLDGEGTDRNTRRA